MSLTTCMKKAGKSLREEDKAAILALSRQHRESGLDAEAAGLRAIEDHLQAVTGDLTKAEAALKAAPKEEGPLLLGMAPGNAEPVTVKDGVIRVGKHEALDFDSGEPIKAPEGATSEDLKRLLKEAGAISSRQKFFGGQEPMPKAEAFDQAMQGRIWRSELTDQIGKASAKTAPASDWQTFINGLTKKGVKPDEIEWSGVNEWLKLQQGKVTKQQVLDYLDQNGVQMQEVMHSDGGHMLDAKGNRIDDGAGGFVTKGQPTKFGNYTLPGGKNYRELLLTLPEDSAAKSKRLEDLDAEARRLEAAGDPRWVAVSRERGEMLRAQSRSTYRSGHWDEPNVLAHVRLNDRTDVDGKKVLFIEELQSDWAQQGRKDGFAPKDPKNPTDDEVRAYFDLKPGADPAEYRREMVETLERRPGWDRVEGNPPVPRAPFVGSTDKWLTLALKRIIKLATDEGYDRVAFVSGKQSADRYDLSKHVDTVLYDPSMGTVIGRKGGGNVLTHTVQHSDQIAEVVGKDVAKKLLESPKNRYGMHEVSGVDLKVGGEGMRTFYDSIVPTALSKLLPKLGGGKLGELRFSDAGPDLQAIASRQYSGADYDMLSPAGRAVVQEIAAREGKTGGTSQPGFDITPHMLEHAAGGMPMFKRGVDLSEGPPLTTSDVKAAVQEIVGRWENGPKVHVVLSARELPGENDSGVRGLYTRDNGVWVVASLNRSRGALAKTLAHEAVAHYGLRDMLGRERFDRLMANIQKGVEAGDKTLAALREEVRAVYDFSHMSEAKARQAEADEIAAAAVEKAVGPDGEFRPGFGFVKAIYAHIAEFLRGLGLNVRFTNAELQGMLVLAQRHLKVGERTAGGGELVMAAAREDGPAQARAAATPEAPAAEPAKVAKPAEPAKERKPYGGPGAELVKSTRDVVGKLVEDAVLKVTPMSGGSDAARAVAKDYANAERLARHKWTQFDDILKKNFTEAERKAMWEAADEQNVLMQEGKDTKGKGLDRLNAEQRKTMDVLHAYGESLLQRARDVGMFKGEGLPYWTPRMAVMIGDNGEYHRPGEGQTGTDEGRGFNVTKTSGNLKQRKYLTAAETEAAMKGKLGEGAQLVRDIRTMPLAMARLERAIAGRELINQIKEIGRTTGIDTTASRDGPNFFTVNHPAFKTMVANQVPVRLSEYFDRKLMDGLTQLADNLGVKHERKGALKGGALGLAYRNKPLVQTKFFTPDQVLTHEIGHQIDFKYGLVDQLAKRGATAKELRALADLRIEGQEGEASDHFKAYLRKGTEKIANLVHAYVHNPERFRTVAPETFKWFDEFVNRTPELAPLKDLGPSLTIGSRQVEGKVTQWEERPLYVSRDFEGPLKAILAEQSGELYKQMMNLKAKSMGLIMYSPLIHNAVEWGRALPIMPGKVLTFRVYFDGNKIKNDPIQMAQAIKDGMVPIGHRGNIQDITGLMEDPSLAPGRSWTSKLLGGAISAPLRPVSKAAAQSVNTAVRKGVDAAGDFWHNTLLWDRVGDLQAGIYGQMRSDMIKKGMDETTSGRLAAHFANRYAGALPNEAMSANARKIANFVLFSRSFTLGNLGVMKDMFTGFPPDIAAQIQRDAGEASLRAGKSVARRTAAAAFALDVALMYAGNALLQSALDKLKRDKDWDEISQGYVDRFWELVHRAQESPLDVLSSPLESLASLTPNSQNEPGKEERIHYGTDDSGTNIYVRSPVGKVGEEFKSWVTSPLETLLRKQGTIMRPITQTIENDKGFGQRVYNPDDKSWPGLAKNLGRVVWNFMSQQVPADSIQAAADWAKGQADDTDKLKVVGPLVGVTFSKGAPGGPEVGEMYHENRVHQGEVADVMPDVRRLIKVGEIDKAIDLMEGAKMTKGQIGSVLKHQQDPASRLTEQALKKYYSTASEESKARMEKYGR